MEYLDYLASDEWYQRAKEARERARWRCELCSARSALEVHHKSYERLGCERNSDLIVLCARCHRLFHGVLEEKRQRSLPFVYHKPRWNELN